MKNKLLIIIFAAVMFVSCGKVQPPETVSLPIQPKSFAKPVVEQKKAEEFKYNYRGDIYRDPFYQITSEAPSQASDEGIVIPALSGLVLQGIIRDGMQSIALLKSGSLAYTLLNGRIYDSRQRLIKGMSGLIKSDSVLITAPDRTKKEIKLREKSF